MKAPYIRHKNNIYATTRNRQPGLDRG
jgi:hypothetical protein